MMENLNKSVGESVRIGITRAFIISGKMIMEGGWMISLLKGGREWVIHMSTRVDISIQGWLEAKMEWR